MNERPLVLVADDDEDILMLVRIRLERAGLRVVAAHDGEDALRLARELKPRLAVLDLAMPKLGGLDVLGALRDDGADTRVVAAHDGEDALRLARELKPRLAVLDLSMPKLGGLDVLGALREDGADTRVVLLTAKAQEADVERGYAAGADAYLTKPFSPAELVERVQALLN